MMVTKTDLENIQWEDVSIEEDPLKGVFNRFGSIVNSMYERMKGLDPRLEGSADCLFDSMIFCITNESAYFHPLGVREIVMTDDYGEACKIRVSFSCAQNSCFADDLNYLRGQKPGNAGCQWDNHPPFLIPVLEDFDTSGEELGFYIDMFVSRENINPYFLSVLRKEAEKKLSDCK